MKEKKIAEAIELTRKKDFLAAKKLFVSLIKSENDPWVQINIANCCIFLNQTVEAEEWLDQSTSNPGIKPEHLFIASRLYSNLFSFMKALDAAKQALKKTPQNFEYHREVIVAAHQARSYDESLNYCREYLKQNANDPWAIAFEGRILSSKGEFSAAEDCYLKAIKIAPQYSYPYSGLAKCKKFCSKDEDIIEIFDKSLLLNLPANDRSRLLYSKAKVLNDQEKYNEAWKLAEEANKLKKATAPFDANMYKQFIDKIITTYQSNDAATSNNQSQHILVVGMPRSGTTLIEQIIAQDANIYPGGETPAIDDALYRQFHSNDYLSKVISATSEDFDQIANFYERYFNNFFGYSGSRILDKVPSNYLHIGVFKQIFPNLKIINLKRNKLDVATSIFFENFSQMLNYSYDFKDTLMVQEQYEILMKHWEKLFPEDILTIEYESFVSDYANHVKAICDFVNCTLPDSGDTFIQSSNSVQTPSLWQVRQKINNKAVNRWKRYQEQIDNLTKQTE